MGFSLDGWLLNFSLMVQPLYALLKNTKSDPIIWKGQDDLAFNILRENLKKNPPTLGHPNHQLLLFLI